MKIIFVTILLTISLCGQDSTDYSMESYSGIRLDPMLSAVIDTLEINASVARTLVNAYDMYKKECYADSTFNKGYHYWKFVQTDDSMGYGVVSGYDVLEYVEPHYSHKQPTFEGFIEYLEKYLKK